MQHTTSRWRAVTTLASALCLFFVVSWAATAHQAFLTELVTRSGPLAPLGFILLTAVFVVFVIPLDLVFLIPIGAAAFGPLLTAMFTITGWTCGAGVAFLIARRWGRPVVGRLINLKRLTVIEQRLPASGQFWTVVGLRLLISVDVLSYALGLMSTMSVSRYLLATLIGVTPFGFFFAYTGTLPLWYRLGALVGAFLFVTFVLWYGIRHTSPTKFDC